MSAASRALAMLADHFERMRDEAREWDSGRPLYSASETWDRAAEMTRATAADETWRHRAVSLREPWYRRYMWRRFRGE